MRKFAAAYGQAPTTVTSNAPYGSPFSSPVKTLAVRPVTGEHPVVAADQRPAPQPAPAKELPYSDTLSRVRAEDPSGPLLGQVPIPPSAKMPQTARLLRRPEWALPV